MVEIRFSKEFIDDLIKFLRLDPEKRTILINELKKINVDASINEFAKNLQNLIKIPQEPIINFVRIIFTLINAKFDSGKTTDCFMKDIFIPSLNNLKEESGITDGQINELINIIENLINGNELIYIRSKVSRLERENPNKILNSSIYTDLRFIFLDDPNTNPKWGIVKHTLSHKYIENNELKEIFLTLNYEGLLELKKSIDRAIQKEITLQKSAKNQGYNIIVRNNKEE